VDSTLDVMREIQEFLASGGQADKERLLQVAANYVLACRAVNERAQRCRDLLREGLRREAVALATQKPTLQEDMNALDCPERTAWVDLCEASGLEVRQYDLNADVASRVLKDLSTDTDKIENLLRLHRYLSLGRAPILQRLRVLRQLSRLDPERTFWQEDVQAFEAARLEELASLAARAAAAQEAKTLEAILAELQSPDWLKAPPGSFVRSVEQMLAPHRQRLADARFAALAEQLHQAHSSQDEARCRDLLAQWRQVIEETAVDPAPALAEHVSIVEAWLGELQTLKAEEKTYQDACAGLEAALDGNKALRVLEQNAAAVLRFGRGIPQLLGTRLDRRIEELRRAARRRFALAMTGIVGALLLVAGVLAAVSYWQSRKGERARWQEQLVQAMQEQNLAKVDEILKYLEENRPDIYATPEIQNPRVEYANKLAQEERRKKELDSYMRDVEKAGDLSPNTRALAEAKRLMATDEEKAKVAAWETRIETAKQERQKKIQDEFDKLLRVAKQKYRDLQEAELAGRPEVESLARTVLGLANDLSERAGVAQDGPAEARKIAQDTRDLLVAIETKRRTVRKREETLDRLPGLYINPEKLAEALNAFGRDFPNDPLAMEFLRAARLETDWKAAETWHDITRRWDTDLRVQTGEAAAARAKSIEDHLTAFADTPYKAGAEKYLKYLQAVQKAFADGALKNLSAIEERLSNPLIAAVNVVRDADGRTYYTYDKKLAPGMAEGVVKVYSFRALIDGQGKVRPVNLRPDQLKGTLGPAPQVLFATEALQRIQKFKRDGWETFYLRLAQLLLGQPDIDPILRCRLLKELLDGAAACSALSTEQIEQLKRPLENVELDVSWMRWDDTDVERARRQAATALGRMASLEPLVESIEKGADALREPLRAYRAVGILLANGDCPVKLSPEARQGELFVLHRNGGLEFYKIGQVAPGKPPEVDRRAATKFPQGSIVYMKSP